MREYRTERDQNDLLNGYCGPGTKMDFRATQKETNVIPVIANLQTSQKIDGSSSKELIEAL